jgi:hypothetical protein
MTLPFSVNKKKRWTCFVCGIELETYEEFTAHIREKHEEGREYLTCPKCQAPVRDVTSHYKAKHPGWSVPKGMPSRAIIWNDFSPKGKKRRKVVFKDGDFVSTKMNGKVLHYRSGYELQVYKLLEQIPEVVHYDAEPLEIRYCHDGEWHNYRPDLSILFVDGHKEIWEIKPKTQTSLPVNEAKWHYAGNYCLQRGWKFEVKTEKGIGQLRAYVRRIHRNGA